MNESTSRPQPKATVFVVEPDRTVRHSLCSLIGLAGYPVEAFTTAEEFLSTWRGGRRGCLISEIELPGMSGLQLQEELAKKDRPPAVIFISDRGDVRTVVRALRAGAVDFIEKPFVDRLVVERIEEVFLEFEAPQNLPSDSV